MKRDEITPHKHQPTQYGLSLHQVLNNLFFLSLEFFLFVGLFTFFKCASRVPGAL